MAAATASIPRPMGEVDRLVALASGRARCGNAAGADGTGAASVAADAGSTGVRGRSAVPGSRSARTGETGLGVGASAGWTVTAVGVVGSLTGITTGASGAGAGTTGSTGGGAGSREAVLASLLVLALPLWCLLQRLSLLIPSGIPQVVLTPPA